MFTAKGEYEVMTLDQLMPKSFGPEDLPPVEELSH
jgi:cytidine deaminase